MLLLMSKVMLSTMDIWEGNRLAFKDTAIERDRDEDQPFIVTFVQVKIWR